MKGCTVKVTACRC